MNAYNGNLEVRHLKIIISIQARNKYKKLFEYKQY